jgi:hypothetical protein
MPINTIPSTIYPGYVLVTCAGYILQDTSVTGTFVPHKLFPSLHTVWSGGEDGTTKMTAVVRALVRKPVHVVKH